MPFILKVALPCPLRFCFDYLPDQSEAAWQRGLRVRVPFGSRELVGIIFDIEDMQDKVQLSKVKPIITRLDELPIISEELLNLISWVSEYYHHPVGDCFQVALPKKIRLGEPALLMKETYWSLASDSASESKLGKKQENVLKLLQKNSTHLSQQEITDAIGNHNDALKRLEVKRLVKKEKQVKKPALVTDLIPLKKLNNDQEAAVNAVWEKQNKFSSILLHGITGSGKTEVYIQLASLVVSKGKQVLILIPEIGLTEQFVNRFKQHLSVCIVVFNSSMNDSERQQAWLLAQSGDADIVIGTRSAVFSPLSRLGLVILTKNMMVHINNKTA